jgi:hypothetical protein
MVCTYKYHDKPSDRIFFRPLNSNRRSLPLLSVLYRLHHLLLHQTCL